MDITDHDRAELRRLLRGGLAFLTKERFAHFEALGLMAEGLGGPRITQKGKAEAMKGRPHPRAR